MDSEQQFTDAFNTLTELERATVLAYMSGKNMYLVAEQLCYDREYLYRVLKNAVRKIVYKNVDTSNKSQN